MSKNFIDILSYDRFNTYLNFSNGKEKIALELYFYNAKLSESFYIPLHIFEITLRNRLNFCVSHYTRDENWIQNENKILDEHQKHLIKKIKNKCNSHADYVAALSLGFWIDFFMKKNNNAYFAENGLKNIFHENNSYNDFKKLGEKLREIKKLRDRIAHHKPIIFKYEFYRIYEDIIKITEKMNVASKKWIEKHSRFNEIYSSDFGKEINALLKGTSLNL